MLGESRCAKLWSFKLLLKTKRILCPAGPAERRQASTDDEEWEQRDESESEMTSEWDALLSDADETSATGDALICSL